jgi:hypothetical protein
VSLGRAFRECSLSNYLSNSLNSREGSLITPLVTRLNCKGEIREENRMTGSLINLIDAEGDVPGASA